MKFLWVKNYFLDVLSSLHEHWQPLSFKHKSFKLSEMKEYLLSCGYSFLIGDLDNLMEENIVHDNYLKSELGKTLTHTIKQLNKQINEKY